MAHLNPRWLENRIAELNRTGKLDVIESYTPAIQALITELAMRGKAYRLYALGAGVKRLTTDTEICPCCKHKL